MTGVLVVRLFSHGTREEGLRSTLTDSKVYEMPSQWKKDIYESSLPKLRVVSVGTLPELLSLRHAVLEGAGFQVLSTSKLEEALLRIENGTCGVLLLCYSLDDDILRRLATQFRKSCPDGRIVALTNRPVVIPPIQADAFAYAVEGSEALIAAVRGDTQETRP